MRLLPIGSELVLQAKLGDTWENLWRLCSHTVVGADYEVANWFTATYPESVFVSNMIAARPGSGAARHTFLNGRVSLRLADGTVERQELVDDASIADVLVATFGIVMSPRASGPRWTCSRVLAAAGLCIRFLLRGSNGEPA
jgi:N-hydroxyarylamine O-acetyltransferase